MNTPILDVCPHCEERSSLGTDPQGNYIFLPKHKEGCDLSDYVHFSKVIVREE